MPSGAATAALRVFASAVACLCLLLTLGSLVTNHTCTTVVYHLDRHPFVAVDSESALWSEFLTFLRLRQKNNDPEIVPTDFEKAEALKEVVPLYIVTPTHANPLQVVHLIRTGQALRVSNYTARGHMIRTHF